MKDSDETIRLSPGASSSGATQIPMVGCEACRRVISSQAPSCPHCGHVRQIAPAIGQPAESTRGLSSRLIFSVVAAGCILFGIYFAATTDNLGDRAAGLAARLTGDLPYCDSGAARDFVRHVMADAPMGRVQGISIVSWQNVRQVSRHPRETRCAGEVFLNNGQRSGITFRFYKQGQDTMIEAELL